MELQSLTFLPTPVTPLYVTHDANVGPAYVVDVGMRVCGTLPRPESVLIIIAFVYEATEQILLIFLGQQMEKGINNP